MASPKNRLIHDLVEQSRDRVAHVRAGQSLAEVWDNQGLHGSPTKLPTVATTLARRSDAPVHISPSDGSGLRATMRKRAAVITQPLHQIAEVQQSSYEQYASYSGSKLQPEHLTNTDNRRKAVFSSTKGIQKLAAITKKKEAEAAATGDSATTKLHRTIAVMKSRHAFFQAKERALRPRHVPDLSTVKNTHMAFLEFRHESRAGRRRADTADVRTMNASSKEPLRFGDVVCLLSMAADVPVAIGRHGRAMTVTDSATGPHMKFTIIDFVNPSRRDDVLLGEPFWLQVDPRQLDRGSQEDDILALLVDTRYYLGCPGWVEEEASGTALAATSHKYNATAKADEQLLRLAAMKATVPSLEYYGDDRATREYTIESNPNIMRLAKWHFAATRQQQQRDDGQGLVLNCATVSVLQGELPLEYDALRRRAVLRGASKRVEDGDTIAGVDSSSGHHGRETCTWQVRLIHRDDEPRRQRGEAVALASPTPTTHAAYRSTPTEKESLEWLHRHTAKVETTAHWIKEKRVLARNARRAYEKVAAQSNAKLQQIEDHKLRHHREYFQQRMDALAADHHHDNLRRQPLPLL